MLWVACSILDLLSDLLCKLLSKLVLFPSFLSMDASHAVLHISDHVMVSKRCSFKLCKVIP